ncbi:MAG: hypothetical protein J6Y20_09550 [Lachnospiraceae bacterium]|nr:hypothetical protein [Lachnospiraceae bacterium]
MSKVWKKVVCLLLIVCMTAALAACDNGNDDTNTSSKTPTQGGAKAAKTLTGAGKLTETPTPTEAGVATPTPTGTETDVTPTAQVTPTVQATPTPFEDDPSAKYEIVTTHDIEGNDEYISSVVITRTTDKGSEVVFDSAKFIEAHRSEWEAEAESRRKQVVNEIKAAWLASGDDSFRVFLNEKQECSVFCGTAGLLEVYSYAAVYPDYLSGEVRGSAYAVSCWLVTPDMPKQYMILYDAGSSAEKYSPDGSFRIEAFYTNGIDGSGQFDARYVRKVLTEVEFREDAQDEIAGDDDATEVYATYYASNSFGELRKLFKWNCTETGSAEQRKLLYGWLFTAVDDVVCNLMYEPWDVFGKSVLQIYDSVQNRGTDIPNIESHVKNGLYTDTKTIDEEYSLRADVEFVGDDVRASVYLTGNGIEVLVDESQCRLFDIIDSLNGERLEVCGYEGAERSGIPGSPEYEGYTEPCMVFRYYPSDDAPMITVDLTEIMQENSEHYNNLNSAKSTELSERYSGSIIMDQSELSMYSLGSFGTLYIIGTGACGESPNPKIKVSGYQVDCIWVRDGELVSQTYLHKCFGCYDNYPEFSEVFMNIICDLGEDPEKASWDALSGAMNYRYLKSYAPEFFREKEEKKNAAAGADSGEDYPDIVTTACFGMKYKASDSASDNGRYESERSMFDQTGKCLLRVYAARSGAEGWGTTKDCTIRDASGNTLLERNTDGTWKVLSYSLKEIAEALMNVANKKSKDKLAEGIMNHVLTVKNEGSEEHVFCDHVSLDEKTELFASVLSGGENGDSYSIDYAIVRNGKVLSVESIQVPLESTGTN